MLEKIYDTIKGILYYRMPKNAEGNVAIYDHVVKGWYFGDRDVKPSNLSIIVYGATSNLADSSFGIQELEHRLTIGVDAGADDTENSERLVQETSRVVYAALKDYRTLWVMDLCPFCGKWAMTPKHFTDQHSTVMAPFVTAAESAFDTRWAETHSSAAPSPSDSGIAADAFLRLYEAVRSNATVNNLTDAAELNIKQMQADMISPIRLLYGVKISEIKPSDDGRGQQLLKQGQFTLIAHEQVPVISIGPDTVPLEAV